METVEMEYATAAWFSNQNIQTIIKIKHLVMMNIMRQLQSNTILFYLIRLIFYHYASLAFILFRIVFEKSDNTKAAKFKEFTQNHHNYVFLLIWPSWSWKTFEHYGSWNFLPSRRMDCHGTFVFCKTSNNSFLINKCSNV